MAHTPGPWVSYPADYQKTYPTDLGPIFVIGTDQFHTVCQVRPGEDDDDLPAQTAANAARLIAAAPDMLKALQAAHQALKSYQYGNASTGLAEDVADWCEATIAMATGEPA